MYIEGNVLILGDSSYLEHHGIKGQRWGVRRFQNRDGSLTNAGRKRLGYATKSALKTVGKAFKAGAKAGGNAVKAAKAHHEKKEAEKLQKKKEKASKSRLGVLANKDLFTDEELRALNQRFKVEDEIKMASIQKGVEIAKAVGTIASNAATAAKAYEDITGESLSPIKRQAAELKKQQDAEDRARKIASEDAEEARKAAQEERNIKKFDQELRKATADADKEEFLAKKTKAQADQEILKALKGARDFDKPDDDDDDPPKPPNGGGGNPPGGGSDDTGKSWMEKATSGGGNVFERMKYENDLEYRAAKDAHDKKVEWEQHEKERDARVFGRDKQQQDSDSALRDMINASERNRKGGSNQEPHVEWNPGGKDGAFTKAEQQSKSRPSDSDEIPFTSKNLRLEKDRYANRDAFKKAKETKDNIEEKRAKEQDDKAAKSAIDTIMKDYKNQDNVIRNMNPGAYDREVAKNVIKSKAKNAINKISHPVDTAAKKIADKHREEKWAKERKNLWKEYEDTREKLGPEAAARAYNNAKKQALQNLGYRGEALDRKMNESKFYKKKSAKHDAFSIQNGVLFVDSSDYLSHHGVKGQKWGVRRFQNPDGTLTDKGRKHYEKALAKEKRKQVSSDAIRGTLERQHPFAVTGSAIAGAIAAGMSIAATGGASVAVIAAGSAISAAVSAGLTHATYSVSEAWEGRGTKMRSKKIAKYEKMLKQSDMEEGMYHVENGTLFIDAGEPYLEHHGVLGMKWGKHLRAGKGPADAPASSGGGGGGAPEEDEETKKKIEEAAKKAGMSVAEYRKKFAKEISRMKMDSSGRKEGSHWDLAKADVHGKTENHMPLLENKHKDKNAKEAMINNARLAETKYKAQQAAQEYTRNHTNSQKDINKWRNAAYLDSSNHLHKELAEARTEKAQQYYKNSVGGKLDRAKRKAGSALRGAKSALKEGPSGIGDRIYDAAGGKYKKQAAANTKAAREDTNKEQLANRMANQQRAREASEVRKRGGRASRDKGFNTVNGHDVIAEGYRNARQKHKEAASEANAKYEKSLAGKYDKLKVKAGNARKSAGEKIYNAAGGKYKNAAEVYRKHAHEESNEARRSEKTYHEQSAAAASYKRKYGDGAGYNIAKGSADTYKEDAEIHKSNAKLNSDRAGSMQSKYEKSLAGRYDKMKAAKKRKRKSRLKVTHNVTVTKVTVPKHTLPKLKHSDDTNAIYTEGTRLVIYPKSVTPLNQDYLEHHGILGQKWGIRRFQNKDGTRTAAGKKRYPNYTDAEKLARSAYHDVENGNYESAAKKYLKSNRMPSYDSYGNKLPQKTDNECISSFSVEVEEMRSNALNDLAVRIDTERKLARGEHVDSIFENDPDCKKMISALKEWEEESLTTADQFRQVGNIMRTMTNDKKETDRTKSDTMRIETLQEHQIQILDEYDLWGHPEYNDNRYNW